MHQLFILIRRYSVPLYRRIVGQRAMRCYLIRRGRIETVKVLGVGTDADLVAQADEEFQKHGGAQRYDGFEVWAGDRFVYRLAAEKQEQPTER